MAIESFLAIATRGQAGKRVPHPPEVQRARGRFFLGKAVLGRGQLTSARKEWLDCAAADPGGEWGGRAAFKAAAMALLLGDREGAKAGMAAVKSGLLHPEAQALHRWLRSDPELPPPLP